MPALALYGVFVLWPLLRSAWFSLQQWSGYGPETFIGLGNFSTLFGDPVFRQALEQSIGWELAAALGVSAAGLGLALLARASRLQSIILATLFFPVLLPATVVASVWTLVYSPLNGLLNTLLSELGAGSLTQDWLGDVRLALPSLFVAWAWSALGIGTLIFWGGLRAIGREYIELALVEGAGPFWRLWHVLLPALRRPMVIVVLVNAALAAQVFDLVYISTGGGPGYSTLLLPIDMHSRAFGGYAGQGAAVAMIQVVIGLVLAGLAVLLLRGHHDGMNDGTSADSIPRPGPGTLVRTAIVLALLALVLLPLAWLVVVGLGWGGLTVGVPSPTLSPATWGWSNFSSVWNMGMGGALETSLLLAIGATVLTLIFAAPAAFAAFRAGRAWKIPIAVVLAIGLFQPTTVIILPLFSLLKTLHLLDTAGGILLPEVARNLPFAILLLWAFLAQLPADILQAAEVDGASPLQQLVRVALPLVRPALFAVMVWAFVGSWNEYLLPTIVSQDGTIQTVPTLLGSFVGRFDTQFGLLAAGSLLALAPSLLVYLAFRRPAAGGLMRLERRIR